MKENPESKYMKYFLVKKKRYSECANNTTKIWGSTLTLILKKVFKEEAGKLLKHDKKSFIQLEPRKQTEKGNSDSFNGWDSTFSGLIEFADDD